MSKLFCYGETTSIENCWTQRQRSCHHWNAAVVCKNGKTTCSTGKRRCKYLILLKEYYMHLSVLLSYKGL